MAGMAEAEAELAYADYEPESCASTTPSDDRKKCG
jgi:hypothetical protein